MLSRFEELLIDLSWWENDGEYLPMPLAEEEALEATRRLRKALAPTQGQVRPRLLAPDGRYEHLPLRVVEVEEECIRVLREAVVALRDAVWFGKPFADVVHDHAHREEPPDAVVNGAARLQRLLELDWTADAKLLADRIVETGTGDLVLDGEGESAYRRFARRTNGAWSGNAVLDGFLY